MCNLSKNTAIIIQEINSWMSCSKYWPFCLVLNVTHLKTGHPLKKYAHGFVVICFVVVMQSFIMNSHEVFIHIHQGCFAGTGAIVRLPQCQWTKPDGYGNISQCITTTKHSKAKTVCIFLGIYCMKSTFARFSRYGPLARYINLRVAHALGMTGTFSAPPRVSDLDIYQGTCVTHVPLCMPGSLSSDLFQSWWRGKRPRHFRRMRNLQFFVSGKRPIAW